MGYNYPGEFVDLGGNRGWLDRPAAESIWRIDRALGHLLQITEAGRTWDQQNAHWLTYLRNGWPIALDPNTPSEHQKGKAIDSNEAQRILAIMEEHGWRRTVYRWVNGVWKLVEEWHFEYFAHLDKHINDRLEPTEEEQIMAIGDELKAEIGDVKNAVLAADRKQVALMWVDGNCWVCDYPGKTRWNVAAGQASVEDAFKLIDVLVRGLGWTQHPEQAPFMIAGLVDITDQGTIKDEVVEAMRELAPKKKED